MSDLKLRVYTKERAKIITAATTPKKVRTGSMERPLSTTITKKPDVPRVSPSPIRANAKKANISINGIR